MQSAARPAPSATAVVGAVVGAAHPGPALAVTVLSAGLARATGLPLWSGVLVVGAVLAGQLSIGWSNDLVDLGRDVRSGRVDKPLATGRAAVHVVRACCATAVVACVALSLACGLVAGLVHLLCVASGWAYNLGLKSTAWSWLPYAVAFGALPVFVGLARGGELLPWWVPVAAALLGVGAHLLNVLPDLDDDAATGVRGLPHRLGARGSSVVAVTLLALASALLVVGARATVGAAGWVGLAVVAVLGATALLGRGRTPFRAAVAIALVDVVIMVSVR